MGAARRTARASPPGANAVTVHGATGTIDIADIVADNGVDLLEIIGKSLAFVGTNAFIGAYHGVRDHGRDRAAVGRSHRARRIPTSTTCRRSSTSTPSCRCRGGRRRTSGAPRRTAGSTTTAIVHLVEIPEHMLVIVNGGLGNLHALALHSFGPTQAVTRSF